MRRPRLELGTLRLKVECSETTELAAQNLMVPETGFEPVRDFSRGIFLLLHVMYSVAINRCCSLDYFLTISFDLGCRCIVSTHLEYYYSLSSSFTIEFEELACIHSESFDPDALFFDL